MRRAAILIVLVASSSSTSGPTASMSDPSQAELTQAQEPDARVGTHATTGIVTFVDPSTLVIVRSVKNASEISFVLTPSTCRDGEVKVGSMVSVRYLTERRALVATGVFVHEHRR